jgi:hypothetical protein
LARPGLKTFQANGWGLFKDVKTIDILKGLIWYLKSLNISTSFGCNFDTSLRYTHTHTHTHTHHKHWLILLQKNVRWLQFRNDGMIHK